MTASRGPAGTAVLSMSFLPTIPRTIIYSFDLISVLFYRILNLLGMFDNR